MKTFEKLPLTKTKNGYVYNQIARNDNAAVYEQKVEKDCNGVVGQTVGYEVFRVLVGKAYSLVQKHGNKKGQVYNYPAAEKFPGNEDGGKILWCYNTKEAAMKKFNEIGA
jgi:hypothetical protein